MQQTARPLPASSPIRFRGRSFMALVLAPEPPIAAWLAELDGVRRRTPEFVAGRPVVLDVSGAGLSQGELTALVAQLQERDLRIMGVEGADPSWLGAGLPPPVKGARSASAAAETVEEAPGAEASPAAPAPGSTSLLLDEPVRSGQSIIFPDGDVTVVGSVASGAEIIAGGSIHIYGTLRGRAIAGSTGNPRARIYCRKLEAELLAIDGLYKTADTLDSPLRGKPVQAWLQGDAIVVEAME